ncbi:hypothetical protein AB0H71_02535 [Nocardia sp. NPDC050697]|uniref:hypothetical protein n=1 Tax=Nocardia sp. NPDC050697 TaxID=3155158 RepID=UPI0033EFBF5E
MKISSALGAAVAVLAVTAGAAGTAGAAPIRAAEVELSPYLAGDTVYFSTGGVNCAIHANGDVGCDIPPGVARWFDLFPITDLAIDIPFLPAHPAFRTHGRPGSPQLPPGPNGYASTISYAGATCYGGGRGGTGCSSKGHSFAFGWSGTQTT